jgi:hypothetical protein
MSIDPISLLTIGTVVSTAGAAFGTMANMQAASYQSQVAAENARRAEESARREVQRSQIEQVDYAQDARSQIGSLVAALSASGFDIGSGTPALQQRALRRTAQRDAERIREEGVTRAGALRDQRADFEADSSMARRRRGFSLFSGFADATSSFIGGATQINRARGLIT